MKKCERIHHLQIHIKKKKKMKGRFLCRRKIILQESMDLCIKMKNTGISNHMGEYTTFFLIFRFLQKIILV